MLNHDDKCDLISDRVDMERIRRAKRSSSSQAAGELSSESHCHEQRPQVRPPSVQGEQLGAALEYAGNE